MLSRVVLVDEVASHEGRVEATPAECEAVAAAYKIERLANFSFAYCLKPLSQGRFLLTGELRADVTQLCVVTLEPVEDRIRETVSVEFWPEAQIDAETVENATAEAAVSADMLPADPPEPITGGRIDMGAFAAEVLSAALNPYPRKTDAPFAWTDPQEKPVELSGPFAALAKLRGGGDDGSPR